MIDRVWSKLKREYIKRKRFGIPWQKVTTFRESNSNWYDPLMVNDRTFISDCTAPSTIKAVLDVISKLEPDNYVEFNKEYYRAGLERFGSKWTYADINTVLFSIASTIKPECYLEIGVRRGRSMAMVAASNPFAKIYGFDLWIENYCGMDNPGAGFVKQELAKIGFGGEIEFVEGDSAITVPRFFQDNPDLYFDIITVDGDHTRSGAAKDIRNVIDRLKIGGIIVFDDVNNQWHPSLRYVWRKLISNSDRFFSHSFDQIGFGVAFAIKKY